MGQGDTESSTRIYGAHRSNYKSRTDAAWRARDRMSWPDCDARASSRRSEARAGVGGRPGQPQLMIIFAERGRLPRLSAGKIAFG
jgi:hypothetical protein